jgi:hypothetical protein
MDGIDMDTKQFFEKIRRENSQRAESSRVDYRCQVLRDLSVSDSFKRLNADFPASEPASPFCPELHEVKQNVCDDHNNHIYASPAPFWKENDTVELFPKKPAVGLSDYTRVVFPATNACNQSRQQATEILVPKPRSSESGTFDPKLRSGIPTKAETAESLNAKATKKPVRRTKFSLDIWKILTILNTLLLVETLVLCFSR